MVEFSLSCKSSAQPCEVTIDEDNGRYMIRKEDTSGEVFNTKEELVAWLSENWDGSRFVDTNDYTAMMNKIRSEK